MRDFEALELSGAGLKAAPRPGFPPSPCIDVCALDEQEVCIGCRRTLAEIVAWASMSARQQREVIALLPRRTR